MNRGRPKAQIKSEIPEVRNFFSECEKLSLSLSAIKLILNQNVSRAPSYRTLQEWRRGTRSPRFAPFAEWLKILKRKART